MATNVLMPKWGLSMQEGTVLCWLKRQGESVEKGEELVEVESEKASNFVEAPASGILARVLVPEGAAVPVTTVIAVIAAPDEEVADLVAERVPPAASGSEREPLAASASEREPLAASGSERERRVDVPASRANRSRIAPDALAPRPSGDRTERRRVPASPAARRLAEKHRLDLSSIRGTGPDGIVVVEDVEAALGTARSSRRRETSGAGPAGTLASSATTGSKLPAAPVTKVAFYSDSHRLDGVLYLPTDRPQETALPAVVFCLGFTYTKELLVPEMARRLSAEGFAALIFDYRGFGASEGPRGRLFPREQVADVRAAVTYLAQRPEVDANRIGLVGLSLGGSHAIYAAGIDERIRSVAAISAPGNCRRWLQGTRAYWEWLEFLARVDADRAARVLGQKGEQVDAWDIVSPDPASRAFLEGLYGEFPATRTTLSLHSATALLEYACEDVVDRIAPRTLLLVHGEDDRLVPPDEARQVHEKARDPRQLVLLAGTGHFDWAMPGDARFDQVIDAVRASLACSL
jgi:pimeloyl-ACP methyl ester carboxylesterase